MPVAAKLVESAPSLKRFSKRSESGVPMLRHTRKMASMRPNAIILHPLPRTVELDATVDGDPRARYFQQATNGLYVRMALLTMVWE